MCRKLLKASVASVNLGSNQPCLGEIGKHFIMIMDFPGGSAGKESACNAGDLGSIPGLERSLIGGKGYPLQYSGLENSTECTVHGVAKSQPQLSDFHFHFSS